MKLQQAQVYEILENKFGKQDAASIIEYLEGNSKLKTEEKAIGHMASIRQELVETKVEILKWTMIFCIGCTLVIISFLALILTK
jgi:hypothetical protein